MRFVFEPAHAVYFGLISLLLASGGSFSQTTRQAPPMIESVDWSASLARQDMVWKRLPGSWDDAAFVGNGLLGAMVMTGADGSALQWQIGRSDVAFRNMRIPVGDLRLVTVGTLQGGEMRLHLHDAEVRGEVRTDRGGIEFRTFTHATDMVQVIEVTATGDERPGWAWAAGHATNTRRLFRKEPMTDADRNAPAVVEVTDAGGSVVQSLKPAGGFAVVWQVVPMGQKRWAVYLSVGFSHLDGEAQKQASEAVRAAVGRGLDSLVASHREWWHGFWPASFVSVPDARLESFYWLQIYKMASATRPGRPALDLMGPWFRETPWAMIWWNLNIQLTYWIQLTSNRLELGDSLIELIDACAPALSNNAREFSGDSAAVSRATGYDCVGPVGSEIGNLAWTLHNYYLQYRYSMDERLLRKLFPLLKRSINYYLHFTKPGPDGKLHIVRGHSPEYPDQPSPNPDTNYDLSLLRWGCQTLLLIAEKLKIEDELIPKWKATLQDLTPYPQDENGLRVSASVPFDKSHRHYSHLLMVYPLYIMTLEQPENRELVIRSLKHWMSLPKALEGYSYTGAASISAVLGEGDEALRYLNRLLDTKVLPNTMYKEAGPVIETPLSAGASLHDMLLSSWGDRIRVFPGVPSAWKDITFRDLRTEGAFLVSAVRKEGRTRWVRIRSLAGEPCRIRPGLEGDVQCTVPARVVGEGTYELSMGKGETALLYVGERPAECVIEPVSRAADTFNPYGLRAAAP